MDLSKIFPGLLYQFRDERELIKAIEELSKKFTKERERIEDYLKDERLASAYAAFYLSTNMPKLEAVFEWLPKEWLNQLKDAELIDLGAGPGTFSFAWRDWLGRPGVITQIETSELMRKQSRKLWKEFYGTEPLVQEARWSGEKRSNGLILFGHSANEIGATGSLRYIDEIGSDHVLFIEPGTKDFFPKMLEIREGLLKRGYHILFPCPTSTDCPLAHSSQDWCHQFIQIKQSSEIERLSQMAKKDRRLLPLTVQAFSRINQNQKQTVRVIRVFPTTKFSHEWEVCINNQIDHYQIMHRGLSKDQLKKLDQVLAGDAVEAVIEKEIESRKRVRVLSLNNHPFVT